MKSRLGLLCLCILASSAALAETVVVDDQVKLRDSTVARPTAA